MGRHFYWWQYSAVRNFVTVQGAGDVSKDMATSTSDTECPSLSFPLWGSVVSGKMPLTGKSKPGLVFICGIMFSFPTIISDLAMCTRTSAMEAIFNLNHIRLNNPLYECV